MENNEYWVYDIVYFKFLIYILLYVFFIFLRDFVFWNKFEKKVIGDDNNIKVVLWVVFLDWVLR